MKKMYRYYLDVSFRQVIMNSQYSVRIKMSLVLHTLTSDCERKLMITRMFLNRIRSVKKKRI